MPITAAARAFEQSLVANIKLPAALEDGRKTFCISVVASSEPTVLAHGESLGTDLMIQITAAPTPRWVYALAAEPNVLQAVLAATQNLFDAARVDEPLPFVAEVGGALYAFPATGIVSPLGILRAAEQAVKQYFAAAPVPTAAAPVPPAPAPDDDAEDDGGDPAPIADAPADGDAVNMAFDPDAPDDDHTPAEPPTPAPPPPPPQPALPQIMKIEVVVRVEPIQIHVSPLGVAVGPIDVKPVTVKVGDVTVGDAPTVQAMDVVVTVEAPPPPPEPPPPLVVEPAPPTPEPPPVPEPEPVPEEADVGKQPDAPADDDDAEEVSDEDVFEDDFDQPANNEDGNPDEPDGPPEVGWVTVDGREQARCECGDTFDVQNTDRDIAERAANALKKHQGVEHIRCTHCNGRVPESRLSAHPDEPHEFCPNCGAGILADNRNRHLGRCGNRDT